MKRKNNSTLISSAVLFQNEGMELNATAADLIGSALNFAKSKRVRVFLSGSLDDYSRAFFQFPAEHGVARLKAYSHGARTAVYECGDGDREVTLTLAKNWAGFDAFGEFERQYKAANASFKLRFGFEFLNSPTLTGLYALESSLPYKVPSSTALPSFRKLLHAETTQGRSEMFGNQSPEKFYYYDRRFAYAADAKLELPCGEPVHLEGSGEGCDFVPYETAFYRVAFWVPDNWNHVGLLPVLGHSGDGWTWPVRGFHQAFVATPELQLAAESGWRYEVFEKWSFQSSRPMEKFVKTLEGLWRTAKDEREEIEADIYRRLVLHAIGGLYARSFERERFVDFAELIERNDAAALNAELTDTGAMVTERSGQRDERFYMPEWTAFIWSRARARLNKALLALPFSSLVGCHVDAVYSEQDLRHFAAGLVGDRVGEFRLKGCLGEAREVRSKADLAKVRAESEKFLMELRLGGQYGIA